MDEDDIRTTLALLQQIAGRLETIEIATKFQTDHLGKVLDSIDRRLDNIQRDQKEGFAAIATSKS